MRYRIIVCFLIYFNVGLSFTAALNEDACRRIHPFPYVVAAATMWPVLMLFSWGLGWPECRKGR